MFVLELHCLVIIYESLVKDEKLNSTAKSNVDMFKINRFGEKINKLMFFGV